MKYKRVLIKLSGEALKGDSSQIFDPELLKNVAKVIREVSLEGAEICIVVGAGNIWRGKLAETIGIESATADYMGMLGTIINGMAIRSALEQVGLEARVMSAINAPQVAEPRDRPYHRHHPRTGPHREPPRSGHRISPGNDRA